MLDTKPTSTRGGSRARVVKALLAAPWVCLVFTLLYINYGPVSTSNGALIDFPRQYQSTIQTPQSPDHELNEFATQWAALEYGGPFDGKPLRKLCSRGEWNTSVVLQLHNAFGGLANIRAMALDFVFLAVHAKTPIILPTFIERNPDDIADIFRDGVANLHFDHFFDKKHFLEHMNQYCPQMKIYENVEDAPHNHTIKEPYVPRPARKFRMLGSALGKRVKDLGIWVHNQTDYSEYDINLVQVEKTYFNYDMEPVPRKRRTFGSLARNRPDIRRLAGKAIFRLAKRIGGNIRVDPNDQIHRDLYMGMHLRTEADDGKAGWLGGSDASFQRQADHVIDIARRRGTKHMYVASGSLDEIHKMAQNCSEYGITVFSKEDLLDEADLAALHKLGFDQQAELDYEILSRSDYFVGPVMSSFTWNIAIRRNLLNPNDDRRKDNPQAVQEYTKKVDMEAGLSQLIERPRVISKYEMEYFGPHFTFP